MGPCCLTWKSMEKLWKSYKRLVLLGNCTSWILRTRNKEPLSEPASQASNVARGNFRIMRFPMRPTCVMSEEKVSEAQNSNPHVQVHPLMCHVLKTSTLFHPVRFSWPFLGLAKWHKVRLHLTMLWRQPIHQRASWSPIAGATNVGSELLLALPEDLKERLGTESRKTRAPAIDKAYIPLFHSSPPQRLAGT